MAGRRDALADGLRQGLRIMVRRGLRGVWLRGDVPPGPFVWAANHHSWWDPFLAATLLQRLGRVPCLIMLQENLERYAFTRRLGVFGTAEHRLGLDLLRAGRVLVIYPEGELRPAGPVGDLADGAAWYARRAGVPLCAVATRVLVRGHQAPEAYVSFAPVDSNRPLGEVTSALRGALSTQLSDMDSSNAGADPRRPMPGYRQALAGRRSWDERIDGWSRRLSWPR